MKRGLRFSLSLGVLFMLMAVCFSSKASAQLGNEVDVLVNDEVKTIVEVLKEDGRFTTLVAALEATELATTLQQDGPFTVFAPTDEAFAKLPKGTVEELLKPENKDKLSNILLYHVLPTKVFSPDVLKLGNKEIKMFNGLKAKITIENKEVRIAGANIVTADVVAENGVVHVIDSVMMPQ